MPFTRLFRRSHQKETGKSAQTYIQQKVIDVAKELILNPSKSISQVAYELGFQYPQHFTRLFKKIVGQTPNEYRTQEVIFPLPPSKYS